MGKIAQRIISQTREMQVAINTGHFSPDETELAHQHDLIAADAACEPVIAQALSHTGMWSTVLIDNKITQAYRSLNL